MKKAKSAKQKSAPKIKAAPANVDAYLARVPTGSRGAFEKMRAAVRSAVPKDAVETISYGIPAFRDGKILVWFAVFADHCSLFPTAAVIAEFENDLKRYSVSKGTVRFPADKPLPIALIKKLVKARVAQIASKKRP
jgi:uncharacterized protein YdhG (YjbR/CyaY superfamily)